MPLPTQPVDDSRSSLPHCEISLKFNGKFNYHKVEQSIESMTVKLLFHVVN